MAEPPVVHPHILIGRPRHLADHAAVAKAKPHAVPQVPVMVMNRSDRQVVEAKKLFRARRRREGQQQAVPVRTSHLIVEMLELLFHAAPHNRIEGAFTSRFFLTRLIFSLPSGSATIFTT